MNPFKTFASILLAFLILGIVSLLFPKDGISLGFTTFRFPSLSEMFPQQNTDSVQEVVEDPEVAVKRMLEETQRKQFAEYADSLEYYENFFRNGNTRFDLPENDPKWFDRFFLNLEIASLGDGVVHIMHYGDSQLEEDRISSTIREDLQEIFGGAGPGLLPAVATIPAMTVTQSSNGNLDRKIVFGDSTQFASHRRYGPLGQVGELNGRATISFKKRTNRKNNFSHIEGFKTVRLLAGQQNKYFKVSLNYTAQVESDSGVVKDTVMRAGEPIVEKKNKLTMYRWDLEYPASGAKIHLSGRAEIYGISADGEYGVAVDNVAMRGSSGTIFHKMDKELLQESYDMLQVKLLILQYGGNLVPGMNADTEKWTRKVITRQIKILQELYPSADILFIGPADMCKQVNGKMQSYPGLARTIRVLREIALENNLAYWDMYRVMGGNQSMIRWVKQNPALGSADYIHFTRAGAQHMGDLFSNAIRMYYDYFKFRDSHKIDNKKLDAIQAFADSLKTDSLQRIETLDSLSADTTMRSVNSATSALNRDSTNSEKGKDVP